MHDIALVLQIVALILLVLAGLSVPARPPFQYGWLGLFFWLLSLMLGGLVLHQIPGS
jgi:hypothetical protein